MPVAISTAVTVSQYALSLNNEIISEFFNHSYSQYSIVVQKDVKNLQYLMSTTARKSNCYAMRIAMSA